MHPYRCMSHVAHLRHAYLYMSESYMRQAPLPPHLFTPHFRHVESIRAPKYTGAGMPPTVPEGAVQVSRHMDTTP